MLKNEATSFLHLVDSDNIIHKTISHYKHKNKKNTTSITEQVYHISRCNTSAINTASSESTTTNPMHT